VRACDSLRGDFLNGLDHRILLFHRDRVSLLRKEHGEFAAQQLVKQYIEQDLLYSRFWGSFLLGLTDILLTDKPKGDGK
jgi:hypothetical protein